LHPLLAFRLADQFFARSIRSERAAYRKGEKSEEIDSASGTPRDLSRSILELVVLSNITPAKPGSSGGLGRQANVSLSRLFPDSLTTPQQKNIQQIAD